MRKNNDRLRSERPPTNRSRQPACQLIFAKKTKIHFIKGTQNIDYYRNEVKHHYGALWSEKWYCLLVPCLTVHSVHGAPATGGTFTPAIASIAEIFVVIEFSNGCFWLTKWLSIVLVDYNMHILTYKNVTCCSHGCVSFFAECMWLLIKALYNRNIWVAKTFRAKITVESLKFLLNYE